MWLPLRVPLPDVPGPYHSDLSPHVNLWMPICLQLKNQFSPCFSFFSTVASSFNLQGHLISIPINLNTAIKCLFSLKCLATGGAQIPPPDGLGNLKERWWTQEIISQEKGHSFGSMGLKGHTFGFVIERVYALISALRIVFLEKKFYHLWMRSENQGFHQPLQVFCLLKWEDSYSTWRGLRLPLAPYKELLYHSKCLQ